MEKDELNLKPLYNYGVDFPFPPFQMIVKFKLKCKPEGCYTEIHLTLKVRCKKRSSLIVLFPVAKCVQLLAVHGLFCLFFSFFFFFLFSLNCGSGICVSFEEFVSYNWFTVMCPWMILRALFAFLAHTSNTLFFTPLHKMSSDYFSFFLKIWSSHSSFSELHLSASSGICAAVMFTLLWFSHVGLWF